MESVLRLKIEMWLRNLLIILITHPRACFTPRGAGPFFFVFTLIFSPFYLHISVFFRNFAIVKEITINPIYSPLKHTTIMKKNNSIWEVLLRIVIAAATAALTALGTTSCMGYGPFDSLA